MNDATLRPIQDVIRQHPELELAILFGSLAQEGPVRPDSDVDLGVSAGRALTSDEHRVLIEELALATGRPVDLIDLTQAGEPLLGQIVTHGLRLTDDPDPFARLLYRHLVDEADFLPYRDRLLAERRRAWIGN